jgi:hypothetical protein
MYKRFHFFSLLVSITFSFFLNICQAQKVINFELFLSPGYSWVNSNSPSELTGYSSKGAINIDLGILTHYYFNKKVGISSGILLKTYKATFSGNEYKVSFDAIDTENESYIRNVEGTGISEVSTLRCISIPIHLFYSYPISRYISFVGEIGPGISIPIQKDCHGTGTFTYTGLYPQYNNVILSDIPPYGYNSNVPVDSNDKLKTNLIIIDAGVSAGFEFSITRYWKFHTALNYNRTITGIIKKEDSSNYHISDDMGSYHSFFNIRNSSASNIFISIGFQKVFLF